MDGGDVVFSSTNLSTIGEAIAKALSPEHLGATKNEEVFLHSHSVTQNAILAAFERVTGEKWTVEKTQSEPITKAAREKLAANPYDPEGIYPLIQVFTFGTLPNNLSNHSSQVWNDKLGLPSNRLDVAVIESGYYLKSRREEDE